MAKFRRKFTRKKRFGKKRSFRKKRGGKGLARIVKKLVRRQMETKTFQEYQNTTKVYASNHASYAASVIPVTPFGTYVDIQQGLGQGGRIGNRIDLVSLRFSGILTPRPYNATFNTAPSPKNVIMWVFGDKDIPTNLPTQGTDFLQLGNGSQGLTNTLTDMMAPVNLDRYRLWKRKVLKVGFASYGGTGVNAGYQSYTNNDYHLNRRVSLNVMPYAIKKVHYDDNDVNPMTRGVFVIFQVLNADGTSAGATNEAMDLTYTISAKYKDA